MAISQVDSDAIGFGVTGAGVVYNFPAGAQGATELDVLCVNSDALISTPAGWVLRESEVGGQGAYIFSNLGTAGSSVTISSPSGAGPFNATLYWSRWAGTNVFDVSVGAQINGINGNTTPAVNTGVLAETGELVVAVGALHGTGVATQNTPVWSSGYSADATATQASGGAGCVVFGGFKLNAGTAAETPNVSWSGAGADERYMLAATFTAAAEPDVIAPDSVTLTTTVGEPTLTQALDVGPDSVTVTVSVGEPTVSQDMAIAPDPTVVIITIGEPTVEGPAGPDIVLTAMEALLECLQDAVNARPNPPAHIGLRVGTEIVHDLDGQDDLCCQGLAYVALGDMWPSSNSFPEQDIVRQSTTRCGPPSWAVDLRFGIVRCSPVVSEQDAGQGLMPTQAQWTEAATQNAYDAASLRRAACCFRNWLMTQTGNLLGMSFTIARQVQANPNGGCVERYATTQIQIPNDDCCL